MTANGVLMIFLIYTGLGSKTLNETIHALLCIFHQKISVLPSQGAPYFCSFCLPVFTACHFNAGESISLTALQANVLSSQRREGCAAAEEACYNSAQLHASARLCPEWTCWHSSVLLCLRESQLGTTAILVSVMLFLVETGLRHSSHHPSDCVNMVTVSSN